MGKVAILIILFFCVWVIYLYQMAGDVQTGHPTKALATCIPDRQCGIWSACGTNGTQTRTCTNVNGCGITINPVETQSCAPPYSRGQNPVSTGPSSNQISLTDAKAKFLEVDTVYDSQNRGWTDSAQCPGWGVEYCNFFGQDAKVSGIGPNTQDPNQGAFLSLFEIQHQKSANEILFFYKSLTASTSQNWTLETVEGRETAYEKLVNGGVLINAMVFPCGSNLVVVVMEASNDNSYLPVLNDTVNACKNLGG